MSRIRPTRGVTLIELLVVLAIMSVSLAVVAPSARAGIAGMKARSAARQVAAIFATARNTAIRTRQATVLNVDEQQRVVRVAQPGNDAVRELALDEDVTITVLVADTLAQLGGQRGELVHSFAFLPDGEVPELAVELRAGNRAIRLTMDALTGALSASEVE